MVVYSLAAPKRVLGGRHGLRIGFENNGEPYTNKTIDLKNRTISEVTIGPATEEEIENTVKVMAARIGATGLRRFPLRMCWKRMR